MGGIRLLRLLPVRLITGPDILNLIIGLSVDIFQNATILQPLSDLLTHYCPTSFVHSPILLPNLSGGNFIPHFLYLSNGKCEQKFIFIGNMFYLHLELKNVYMFQ